MKTALRLTLLALIGITPLVNAADTPVKPEVLLLTGDDVSSHNWRDTSQAMREILEQSGKLTVRVSEDPMLLESEQALQRYDVILLALYNSSIGDISDQAKENLLNFVKSGKGFVVTHLSSASYKDWQEFGNLTGRKWVMGTSGHGPRSVFESKVVRDHPITKGLPATFQTDDELYAKLQGDAEITVLVEADSDWSQKTEPLVFIRDYGKGRVFHYAYGHDRKATETPEVRQLLINGTQWAATGEVK